MFLIDDLRNGGDENKSHGVNEVRLKQDASCGKDCVQRSANCGSARTLRVPGNAGCRCAGDHALFIVGRERAKLGYFWRHAYRVPRSGPYLGCVVNSDTGKPVIVDDGRLTAAEFERSKSPRPSNREAINPAGRFTARSGRPTPTRSAAWRRLSSSGATCRDGLTMPFATKIHQLAGDTAQGNALGTLASCTDRIVGLTGTLLGGYADDLFNTLVPARSRKDEGTRLRMGHDRTKFLHPGLWRA